MAIVKPFRGIRPSERLVEKIVVKPFDVLNMDEADTMIGNLRDRRF